MMNPELIESFPTIRYSPSRLAEMKVKETMNKAHEHQGTNKIQAIQPHDVYEHIQAKGLDSYARLNALLHTTDLLVTFEVFGQTVRVHEVLPIAGNRFQLHVKQGTVSHHVIVPTLTLLRIHLQSPE